MSIKTILKESVAKNPTGLREALLQELRERIAVVLEAKKEEMSGELDEAQIDKMKKVSKGYPTRPEAERANNRLVHSKKASPKSYVDKIGDEYFVLDLKENASQYRVDTGPLMKVSDWIRKGKLSKVIDQLEKEGETGNVAIGILKKPGGRDNQIAILIHDAKPEQYFKKGMDKPHTFYYDTGHGHRQTSETITITGVVRIDKDGDNDEAGKMNMNAPTTLMVFK